ncbi:MAG: hypothetical protein Fur0032_24280 [Terrimicrobiaceae bacterium]
MFWFIVNWKKRVEALSPIPADPTLVGGSGVFCGASWLERSTTFKPPESRHFHFAARTRVRQLLGHERFEDPAVLGPLNELYPEVWEPLHNFFLPYAKLEAKSRHEAKVKRKHDRPKTPCDRLLESKHVSWKTKANLRARRAALDPFALHERLEKGLSRVSFGPKLQSAYGLLLPNRGLTHSAQVSN